MPDLSEATPNPWPQERSAGRIDTLASVAGSKMLNSRLHFPRARRDCRQMSREAPDVETPSMTSNHGSSSPLHRFRALDAAYPKLDRPGTTAAKAASAGPAQHARESRAPPSESARLVASAGRTAGRRRPRPGPASSPSQRRRRPRSRASARSLGPRARDRPP